VARIDAERLALRVLGGPDGLGLFEEALEVRLLPEPGPASWWRDRLRFLRSAAASPLRAAFGAAPPLSSSTLGYDPAAGREAMREYRRHFVKRHFDREVDFVGRGQIRSSRRHRGPWLRWYLFGLLVALLSLLDLSARRYLWWAGIFADIQAFARVRRASERVYLFGLYDRRPYVMGAFLKRHTDLEVYLVYQNIPLYRNCRHLHFAVPVVLTSRVNLAEVEYYRSLGQFRATDVIYASQEFGLDMAGLEPSPPRYDIGFFSSGEWARKGGLYQSDDVDAIRRGAFLGNEYALKATEILDALAEYGRSHGRTLRVYPHPLERRLKSKHGIEPPFARLADGQTLSVDWSGESSRAKIYEPTAAVSLQSSFIWERLDLGLDSSFIYEWDDAEKNPFAREALGAYARNLFQDVRELAEELDAALPPRAAEQHPGE
jgi:hypothetical protein